jgi:hypothetical protein
MALRAEHELHQRRRGRNTGVGILLVGFITLIFALTFVKVTSTDFDLSRTGVEASQ